MLVPPVFDVTGTLEFEISTDMMTLKALICSPTPKLPSHAGGLEVHLMPHVFLSSPPLQEAAAAEAEAKSRGMIIRAVQGAIWVVAAYQRDR